MRGLGAIVQGRKGHPIVETRNLVRVMIWIAGLALDVAFVLIDDPPLIVCLVFGLLVGMLIIKVVDWYDASAEAAEADSRAD